MDGVAEREEELEKVSIVELRQNSKQVLEHYEEDYKNDLAIHLYSAYLMHQQNPLFPHHPWTSWPKAPDVVPDPKTIDLYTDEPETVSVSGIGRTSESSKLNNISKVNSRSDPKEILKIELERLFKRKIHHQISNNPNEEYYTQPSLEHIQLPSFLMDKITTKIDDLMKKFTRDVGFIQHDWEHLLIQAGDVNPKCVKKAEHIFINSSKDALKEFNSQQHNEIDSDSDDDSEEESEESTDGSERKRTLEETRQAIELRKQVVDMLYQTNKVRKKTTNFQYKDLEI